MKCSEKRYRVVTGIAPPFVMYNSSDDTFYGYCIDLLNDIQSLLGFDYDIRESYDKHFGYIDSTGNWNGMVYELMNNLSDLAVAPLWISSDRHSVVDFTIPFYRQNGFTIMMLRPSRTTSFFKFLTVVELKVWLSFALAFLLATCLIYVFERYSPFSYKNNREQYRGRPGLFSSLKDCFWLTGTAIIPQASSVAPKCLSAKVASASWWLLGFVIAAVYGANLSTYETLSRLESHIESLDDLRQQHAIEYSTVGNSSVARYFEAMKEIEEILLRRWSRMITEETNSGKYAIWEYPLADKYTKIYEAMSEQGFLPSVEKAVEMVRKVNRTRDFAFIGESITIRYIILRSCDFLQAGGEFSKKPFAIAVPKGSPLKKEIDQALTTLFIRRRLDELERKWWDENPMRANCPPLDESSNDFDLDNLGGVFLLILAGILVASAILCTQYLCHNILPRYRAAKRLPLQTHLESNQTQTKRVVRQKKNFLPSF